MTEKRICPKCGGSKDFYAKACRKCAVWPKRGSQPWAADNLAAHNAKVRAVHTTREGVVGKDCRVCGNWQALIAFSRLKGVRDGLENRCKRCNSERSLAYYHRNSKLVNESRRTPEFRERMRPYHSAWEKRRRRENMNYKLTKYLRHRLWKEVRREDKAASALTLVGCSIGDLRDHLESQFQTGMSWENYGKGGWEIDHIRPCSSFNLTDHDQQRTCFHYTNLQPLWAVDNWKKGSKVCASL